MPARRRVLVAGATGWVGSRLVPELLTRGQQVVATRHADHVPSYPWVEQVEWRRMDVLDQREVLAAVDGTDAVVYLVHGLDSADFTDRDRESAQNMRDAVDRAGVPRVVYLSGMVPDVEGEELSEHLTSRLEVERILEQSTAAALALRAAIVLGSGSTSFEIVRQISENLGPVQTVPGWMRNTRVQPIAVHDAVHYLAEALDRPDVTGHLDIGGPEVVRYSELLKRYAHVAGLHRIQVPIPDVPTDLVGWLASRFTDVATDVVMSLMASLRDDMVATVPAAPVLGEPTGGLVPLDTAIDRALRPFDPAHDGAAQGEEAARPSAGDPAWTREHTK